jgi:hypothetical protein
MQTMPNKAMDPIVSLERVKRVKSCSLCGVPETFISRIRGETCAVCAAGMRMMRNDAEVDLLRRFSRELWSMRSLQPTNDPVISENSSWRKKIEAWIATKPAIVDVDAALRVVDLDPALATNIQRARARATLRALGQAVERVKYRSPPQGLAGVQETLQRLGKAEVTIDELLPPEARGDRRRIKIVARALAYLGWQGARSSIGQGKRALLYRAPVPATPLDSNP